MLRYQRLVASGFVLCAGLVLGPACGTSNQNDHPTCNGRSAASCSGETAQVNTPNDGVKNDGETDIDCGGPRATKCAEGKSCAVNSDCTSRYCTPQTKTCAEPRSDDNAMNGLETDVDCGGANAPKCGVGKSCLVDSDCNGACTYANKCVDAPSCKPHLGGDTCGRSEVGETGAVHESCCRTLPVAGYTDPQHPGKAVYLDKYEITSGRVRAFINAISAMKGGKPNIRDWVVANPPAIWDNAWNKFLPSDFEAETTLVDRRLLGDRRGGADEPPIPAADQNQNVGVNFQFNGQLFVYLHGNNCSTHAPDSFGFPTFFYPPEVLAKTGPETFPPRADGKTVAGAIIPASEHLEVKAMNCITNALLTAFCHWDGGQLATNDVLDFVTGSPKELGDMPGCGTQIGTENPPTTAAATKGGRCADLGLVNATFDAGGTLPVAGSPLNVNNYVYPFFPEGTYHDKAWEISAPGRGSLATGGEQVDMVRIHPGDEPWMDLAGNLSESVLTMDGSQFTGKFGLKYRGIGYQSARSELNIKNDWEGEGGLRRIERPEARGGFAGGRCMRFK